MTQLLCNIYCTMLPIKSVVQTEILALPISFYIIYILLETIRWSESPLDGKKEASTDTKSMHCPPAHSRMQKDQFLFVLPLCIISRMHCCKKICHIQGGLLSSRRGNFGKIHVFHLKMKQKFGFLIPEQSLSYSFPPNDGGGGNIY